MKRVNLSSNHKEININTTAQVLFKNLPESFSWQQLSIFSTSHYSARVTYGKSPYILLLFRKTCAVVIIKILTYLEKKMLFLSFLFDPEVCRITRSFLFL